MADDILEEADELFGGSSDTNVSPDSKVSTPKKSPILKAATVDESKLPDYDALKALLLDGQALYGVKNTSNHMLLNDWDRALMPADLNDDFQEYLSQKYIDYDLPPSTVSAGLVAIYIDGKTVSFLEGFMNEREIPTLVPMQIGKETRIKSQFIIRPGEEVICTEKQLESLARYEKIKREFASSDDEPKHSDWLGFLIFRELDTDNLGEIKRSYVTYEDVMKGRVDVNVKEVAERTQRKTPGIVRAKA